MPSQTTPGHTILSQLGGNKFIAMTGARRFSWDDNGRVLSFALPIIPGHHMRITLTAMDDYQLELIRFRAGKATSVKQQDGVHCDNLQAIFTEMTGLRISLTR